MKSSKQAILECLGDGWVSIEELWKVKCPRYVTKQGPKRVCYGSFSPCLKKLVDEGLVETRLVGNKFREYRLKSC